MKKFLSILLALCLMVSCAAFAESNTVEYDYDEDGVVDLIRYFDEDDETIWRTDYFTDGQLSSIYCIFDEDDSYSYDLYFDAEGNPYKYEYFDTETNAYVSGNDFDNLPFDLAEVVFPEIEFTLE